MFGISGFIIIGLALATALVLLLFVGFGGRRGVIRVVSRSFWCPVRRQDVTAEFQEDAWDGTRLTVNRCTAFTPPTAINCDRLCLDSRLLRSARKKAKAA